MEGPVTNGLLNDTVCDIKATVLLCRDNAQ